MELKDKKYFYFTQNSLNTFKNCAFKFKKIYIDNIRWQDEDNSLLTEHSEFGSDFHKIAHRYFMKIPVFEESFKDNEDLYKAFLNLKEKFPLQDNFKYYPEYTIRYSDRLIRLEANIDLIIEKDAGIEVWDWKTNAKSNGEKYEKSLQTEIYMFVLKKCCKSIFGKDFDNIKMVYFSPERKEEIVSITYSEEKYNKDEKNVTNLIEKVYNFKWDEFDKTKVAKQCKFCEFRVFCNSQVSDEKNDIKKLYWEEISEVF